VLTLAALIFLPQEHKPPPGIITAATADEQNVDVGQQLAEFELSAPQAAIAPDPTSTAAALGGSTGTREPDLALLSGPTVAGSGQGTGAGAGDGVGKEADARIAQAGGRGGVVQIALLWDDRNDLDLHVVTPRPERIFYVRPTAQDGGELDVDMNQIGESTRPVENIRWLTQAPRDGVYTVQVQYYQRHDRTRPTSPFRVLLRVGELEKVVKAVAKKEQEMIEIAEFEIRGGRPTRIDSNLKEVDAANIPEVANDPRRSGNREQFAKQELDEALQAKTPALIAGKLRRLIQRFPGTAAAQEAQRRIDAQQ